MTPLEIYEQTQTNFREAAFRNGWLTMMRSNPKFQAWDGPDAEEPRFRQFNPEAFVSGWGPGREVVEIPVYRTPK